MFIKFTILSIVLLTTGACTTSVAIVDVAATTAIYSVKTAVNIVDAITPDIINKASYAKISLSRHSKYIF